MQLLESLQYFQALVLDSLCKQPTKQSQTLHVQSILKRLREKIRTFIGLTEDLKPRGTENTFGIRSWNPIDLVHPNAVRYLNSYFGARQNLQTHCGFG